MANKVITNFTSTVHPIPGVYLGMSDGTIVFLPEKTESNTDQITIKIMKKRFKNKILTYNAVGAKIEEHLKPTEVEIDKEDLE